MDRNSYTLLNTRRWDRLMWLHHVVSSHSFLVYRRFEAEPEIQHVKLRVNTAQNDIPTKEEINIINDDFGYTSFYIRSVHAYVHARGYVVSDKLSSAVKTIIFSRAGLAELVEPLAPVPDYIRFLLARKLTFEGSYGQEIPWLLHSYVMKRPGADPRRPLYAYRLQTPSEVFAYNEAQSNRSFWVKLTHCTPPATPYV